MLRALIRAAGILALVGASSSGWAVDWTTQNPATMTQISARSVGVTQGSLLLNSPVVGQGVVTGVGSGWQIATTQQGPGPAGNIPVAVKRGLTSAALARAMFRSLPLVGGLLAVKDLMDEIRCEEMFGGSMGCDLGQPEQTTNAFCFAQGFVNHATWVSPALCRETSASALAAMVEAANSVGYKDGTNTFSCPGSGYRDISFFFVDTGTTVKRQTTRINCSGSSVIGTYTEGNWNATSGSQTACPSIVAAGQTWFPVIGIDGKCPTGTMEPVTELEFVERVDDYTPPARFPNVIPEIINAKAPIDHPQPVSVPETPTVVGGRETTSNPDGGTTVRDTVWDISTTPEGYGWQPRVIIKTYPPGATIPPPGQIDAPDSTIEGGTAPGTEIITCGLPNTPPCKIDEAGTPPPPPPDALDPEDDPIDPLRALITDPQIPEIAWTWSFQLPAGCSVIELGEFGGQVVSFDLCRFQPMMHDLMSMFWAALGVLTAWALLSRTFGGAT